MATLQSELQKPVVQPIILFEIDITRLASFWRSCLPFVYCLQLDGNYTSIDDAEDTFFDVDVQTFPTISKVGSVIAGDVRLLETFSQVDCMLTDSSFFYEGASKTLYVHCPGGVHPLQYQMKIGASYGYRMFGSNSYSYFHNFIYDDRVLSIPSISKGLDNYYSGKVSFEGGSVVCENSDGYFDQLIDKQRLFGADARIYWGTENLAITDFKKLFSGYVRDIDLDSQTATFHLTDQREKLSKNIIQNYFTTIDYPDLDSTDKNKPIPVVYGKVKNTPVIMVTKNRSSTKTGNHTGIAADVTSLDNDIKRIQYIYVDGVQYSTASTEWSYQTSNASVSLSTAIYTKEKEVTADIEGYTDSSGNLIENSLAIITDLMRKIYNIPFTSSFFSLANWDQARALKVGFAVLDNTKLMDGIESLTQSSRASFIIQDDGKFSCRIFYNYGVAKQDINHNDLLELATVKYETSESLTSLTVKYNKDWSNDKYLSILNEMTNESDIFDKLLIYRNENFETLINNDADAQTFATAIIDLFGTAQKFITITTFINSMEREPGDIVLLTSNRPELPNFSSKEKCEVMDITKNPQDGSIQMRLRVFEKAGTYLYHQGIGFGDNGSNAIAGHSMGFGCNGANQIGTASSVFGGSRYVSVE